MTKEGLFLPVLFIFLLSSIFAVGQLGVEAASDDAVELLKEHRGAIQSIIASIEKGDKQAAIEMLTSLDSVVSQARSNLRAEQEESNGGKESTQTDNVILVDDEPQKYYPRGKSLKDNNFTFSISGDPVYRNNIGGSFGKTAGEGAIYLLVPIKVRNHTDETESLPLTTTWEVIDIDQDYTYEVATKAEIYLDQGEEFETDEVPPGLTREGYKVFEIRESSRNNRLALKKSAGLLWSSSEYYFAINF